MEHLHPDQLLVNKLKDYLGGKDMPSEFNYNAIPPTVPPIISNHGDGDDSNKNKLPELRSPEVNEVLSEPPSWLIQWGITVFFGVLLALFAISWFIQYPDLVTCK